MRGDDPCGVGQAEQEHEFAPHVYVFNRELRF